MVMAFQSSFLQLSTPLFRSSSVSLPPKPHHMFVVRASSESDSTEPTPQPDSDSDFEARLSRLRYRSGMGKKAEQRKVRKSKKGGSAGSGSGSGVFLPPVPLKEPKSRGLKVDFGFSPYSERVNGQIAILGLSALLLVELATGKSTINYHSPAIVFIQIYLVAAVSALYVKYQKEKVSVWPTTIESVVSKE